MSSETELTVEVLTYNREPCSGCRVSVAPVRWEDGARERGTPRLLESDDRGLYRHEWLEPGRYLLRVEPPSSVQGHAPENLIVVDEELEHVVSHVLPDPEFPVFRLGNELLPLRPVSGLVGAVFEHGAPDPERARELLCDSELRSAPQVLADGSVWLFGARDLVDGGEDERAAARLGHWLQERELRARVARPLEPMSGPLRLIDTRFLVRFGDPSGSWGREVLERLGARPIYRHERLGVELWHSSLGLEETCRAVEDLHGSPGVEFAEMNLMAEGSVAQRFPAVPPADASHQPPGYGSSLTALAFTTQTIYDAWASMPKESEERTVRIGVLDERVPVGHDDLRSVPDEYRDFAVPGRPQPDLLTVTAYEQDHLRRSHGLKVLSIIGGETSPGQVVGIAPKMEYVAAVYPPIESDYYDQVCVWLAGLSPEVYWSSLVEGEDVNVPVPGLEPLAQGCDVLCVALEGVPLSHLRRQVLKLLTDEGRGGLGVVTVYAAGNAFKKVSSANPVASHPRTLCVAECAPPEDEEKPDDIQAAGGAYGPQIDLCAQGDIAGAEMEVTDAGVLSNYESLGGSSGAAATVAGVVALLLAKNREAGWMEVRDALRSSARKVDPGHSDWGTKNGRPFNRLYGYGRLDASAALAKI